MNGMGLGFPSPPLYVNGIDKLNSGVLANAATLDVVMTMYGSYKNKLLVLNFLPSTDDVSLYLRVSNDGGLTFDAGASDYLWGILSVSATEGPLARLSAAGDTKVPLNGVTGGSLGIGNQSGEGISCSIMLWNTTEQNSIQRFSWNTVFIEPSITRNSLLSIGSGQRRNEQTTNAVRLLFSSGNIASGKWELYGYS